MNYVLCIRFCNNNETHRIQTYSSRHAADQALHVCAYMFTAKHPGAVFSLFIEEEEAEK